DAMVVFDNPSEGLLHALLALSSEDGGARTYHKYAHIEAVSISNEVQSPVCHALSCYPNPFQGRLNIRLETDKAGAGNISIYNIGGQKVRNISLHLAKGENQIL